MARVLIRINKGRVRRVVLHVSGNSLDKMDFFDSGETHVSGIP